jgi:hypothetical protein
MKEKMDTTAKTESLTDCVSDGWAGVDSAWDQKKLEARKMLACTIAAGTGENAVESHLSSARFVRRFCVVQDSPP